MSVINNDKMYEISMISNVNIKYSFNNNNNNNNNNNIFIINNNNFL